MHRFYADDRGVNGETAFLCEEDARHATRVLRMKEGEACELFADGKRFSGEISSIGEEVEVRITGEMPSTEARLHITLYQGLPKADKMELIVQKSVELGACAVVPVAMSRCVVQLDAKDGRKKQERWQKIAREAAKQSGRAQVPTVHAPVNLGKIAFEGALVIPWEDEHSASLTAYHRAHPDLERVSVLIGPEGGIAPEEIAQLPGEPITLGPRILRTETAGLCALSALYTLYGDLGDNAPC